jgi:SAM-dependent methyltransferase
MFERLRGLGIKSRLLNPYDAFWDWKLGVHTFGYHPARGTQGESDWQLHYTPTPYADIFRLLRMVDLGKDDVFVDLGAGLGRAVFAASWLGAKRSVGVEIVKDLCERAQQNVEGSRLVDRDIEFICTNALNYSHRDTTVLFMFHPFGEQTMRQVLREMGDAIADRTTQRLRIIYMNPVFDDVLEQSGWLRRIARVPRRPRFLSTANSYVVSLWQSSAQGGRK